MALLRFALMAAAPASAVLLSDATGMPSQGEARAVSAREDEDPCSCLPWYLVYEGKIWQENEYATEADPGFMEKEVEYANETTKVVRGNNFGATCGDGHELDSTGYDFTLGQEPVWDPWREFCVNFFPKLKYTPPSVRNWGEWFADCVNYNRTDPADEQQGHGGQWCYVRPTCALGYDMRVKPNTMKLKRCQQGQDPMLRYRTPAELFNMSQEMNLDMSTLVKLAYPVLKHHSVAPDTVVDGRVIDLGPMKPEPFPVVLDSNNSRPPFIVQDGYSQYQVLDNMDHMRAARPMTFTEFVCANTSYQPCKDSLKVNWKARKQLYSWH